MLVRASRRTTDLSGKCLSSKGESEALDLQDPLLTSAGGSFFHSWPEAQGKREPLTCLSWFLVVPPPNPRNTYT